MTPDQGWQAFLSCQWYRAAGGGTRVTGLLPLRLHCSSEEKVERFSDVLRGKINRHTCLSRFLCLAKKKSFKNEDILDKWSWGEAFSAEFHPRNHSERYIRQKSMSWDGDGGLCWGVASTEQDGQRDNQKMCAPTLQSFEEVFTVQSQNFILEYAQVKYMTAPKRMRSQNGNNIWYSPTALQVRIAIPLVTLKIRLGGKKR